MKLRRELDVGPPLARHDDHVGQVEQSQFLLENPVDRDTISKLPVNHFGNYGLNNRDRNFSLKQFDFDVRVVVGVTKQVDHNILVEVQEDRHVFAYVQLEVQLQGQRQVRDLVQGPVNSRLLTLNVDSGVEEECGAETR